MPTLDQKMGMLGNIAEGAFRGIVGYFLDEKEPQYELNPVVAKALSINDLAELMRTKATKGQAVNVHADHGGFSIVNTKTQRDLVQGYYLDKNDPIVAELDNRPWDKLHRSNTTLLWEAYTQSRVSKKPADKYFSYLYDAVNLLVGTNQARLVRAQLNKSRHVTCANVILTVAQPEGNQYFMFTFKDDDVNWSLNEGSPKHDQKVTPAIYVKYDDENRLSSVIKYEATQISNILVMVDIEWLDRSPVDKVSHEYDQRSGYIPEDIIQKLEIRIIYNMSETVSPVDGRRYKSYTCSTSNGQYLRVTVVH